jgi:hypothetical protein
MQKQSDEVNIKFRKMYWLLERNCEPSVQNTLVLYKQFISPVWSYSIQLWRCASESYTEVIQLYQNKVLRCIVSAPWYQTKNDEGNESKTTNRYYNTLKNLEEEKPCTLIITLRQ